VARVLVIDDEPDVRWVLRLSLERAGHEVIMAEDGLRGVAMAQRQRPDVIVLDLMMPVMDGYGVLDALAFIGPKADAYRMLPRIFMNGGHLPDPGVKELRAKIRVAVDPDLTVVNRLERETLTREDGLVAVTLGAEGALLLEDGEEVARAASPPVEVVDGTGAGDAFTACLLVSLLEGRAAEEALARACVAGALAASRRGAQPSLPTAAEVDELVA